MPGQRPVLEGGWVGVCTHLYKLTGHSQNKRTAKTEAAAPVESVASLFPPPRPVHTTFVPSEHQFRRSGRAKRSSGVHRQATTLYMF